MFPGKVLHEQTTFSHLVLFHGQQSVLVLELVKLLLRGVGEGAHGLRRLQVVPEVGQPPQEVLHIPHEALHLLQGVLELVLLVSVNEPGKMSDQVYFRRDRAAMPWLKAWHVSINLC